MRKYLLLTLLTFVLSITLGCGSKTTTKVTKEVSKTSQTSNTLEYSFIELNSYNVTLKEKETFQIEVKNNKGSVSFVSSDESIASVSDEGLVKALKKGNATITVSSNGDSAILNVSVEKNLEEAVNFSINKEISVVYLGYSKELTIKLVKGNTVLNPLDYNLTFTVDDKAIVEMDGLSFKALSIGNTSITASVTIDGITYTDKTDVVVKTMSVIEISEDELYLSLSGDYNTKKINAIYKEALSDDFIIKDKTFTYVSNNPEIVSVNSNGEVTGLKEGFATVTVSVDGVNETLNIRVFDYYQVIHTAFEFLDITNHLNGYFELGNDIDFENQTFTPIALSALTDSTLAFNGIINGNGYTVKNIYHDKADNRAIITVLGEKGQLYNINFENVTLPNSRAARSAGVVWSNFGLIKNVKASVTTSGSGSSVNEWGFGGLVSANRTTGIVYNSIVILNDLSKSEYTASIFNVNQGGKIYNNISLVNKELPSFTHTGSYGSFYNNQTVYTLDELNIKFDDYQFDGALWQKSKVDTPSLINEGNQISTLEMLVDLSSNEAIEINLDANSIYYYLDSEKTYINITKNNEKTLINRENISLSSGINYLFVSTDSDFYSLKLIGISAYINTLAGLEKLNTDSTGYYILNADLELGTLTSSFCNEFSGTLDLDGHKLTYAYSTNHYVRLFNKLTETAVIKNGHFNLTGADNNNKAGYAGLAYQNYGLVENCFFDVVFNNVGQGVNDDGGYTKAGVVLRNYGTINNIIVKVNYVGTTVVDNANGKSLIGCVSTNNGKINNVAVIFIPTQSNSTTVAVLRNYGSISNVLYKESISDFMNDYDSFKNDGFKESDSFKVENNKVIFYSKIVLE